MPRRPHAIRIVDDRAGRGWLPVARPRGSRCTVRKAENGAASLPVPWPRRGAGEVARARRLSRIVSRCQPP